MKEYKRECSIFSLCGLNCGLCPRYNCNGESKCPGCGGENFHLKHPTCSVITCNQKNDNVEYCFQCRLYPCKKYAITSKSDSFISYINVKHDFEKCKNLGIDQYKKELNKKIDILKFLLKNYNNGRLKQFYCNAVNLLEIKDLEKLMNFINEELEKEDLSIPEKIDKIIFLLEEIGKEKSVIFKLRK